jgi:hypothetical protein
VSTVADNLRHYVGAEPGKPLPAFAWPGGYALDYITPAGDELCAVCATADIDDPDATDPPTTVMAFGANADYPETDVRCDNCNALICEAAS